MKLLSAIGIAVVASILTASAFSYDAISKRFDLVRYKALGRIPGLDWADLLTGLAGAGGDESRTSWMMGYVRLVRADLGGSCPALWDTPFGQLRGNLLDEHDMEWYVGKYMHVGTGAAEGLLPEFEPGDVVVELGAWVGVFTRVALAHGAGRVIAVEPVPGNLDCLRLNLADEIADGRVTVIPVAAWREAGEVGMVLEGPWNHQNSSKGYNVVDGAGEFRVPAQTLDSIVAELGLDRLDVLNMDVEGAERFVLEGGRETIQRFAPQIIMCIHHRPDDIPLLLDAVRAIRPEYRERQDELHARFY